MEPLGKGCDRSVRTPELLQNAASGGVRERAERGIEVSLAILNHTVQYNSIGDGMQWEAGRPPGPNPGLKLSKPPTTLELSGATWRLRSLTPTR